MQTIAAQTMQTIVNEAANHSEALPSKSLQRDGKELIGKDGLNRLVSR